MVSWRFFEPPKLFFGENALFENGHLMRELGRKAVITTGKSSSRNGSLDDLKDVLDEQGVEYEIYNRVGENPSFDMLRNARKLFQGKSVDFVIGLGGGSPMDFAKALAILLSNPDLEVEEIYNASKYDKMLPVVEIPTTSGTGSEVTQYSVITSDEGYKGGFGTDFTFPTISFADPRYTVTMPTDLTMSTGIDALCHAIEGFVSRRSNRMVQMMASEAVNLIRDNLEMAMKYPDNLEVRERMMYASTLAGVVIAQSGTTVNHAFGYPVTTFKGVRHGQATGMFLIETLKVMMEENGQVVREAIKPFGDVENLEKFLEKLGVYNANITISDEDIENWSKRTSKAKHLKVTYGNFDYDTVRSIYEKVREKL